MSTETQIRTRHEHVESSSSKELMGEKNSQAHNVYIGNDCHNCHRAYQLIARARTVSN